MTMKINAIQKVVLVLFSLGLFLPGCADTLVQNPKTSVSQSNFWNTEEDAHKALMGIYSTYNHDPREERFENLDKSMIWMSSWAGYSSWRTFAWARPIEIQPTHGGITTVWNRIYEQIARANYFLDNIGNVEMDETEKASMKGESRFLRAFSYFWLFQLWENVPLIKETLTFNEANSVSQASKEDIVNFILTELTEVAQDLPVDRTSSEEGRVEKGAALALKGRLLMSEERWSEAATTYKEIMDLSRYVIDPRYKELFEDEGENNDEVIFANQYMEGEWGEQISQNLTVSSLYGGINGVNIFQHALDKFPMIDGKPIDESEMYDPDNPFENRDPRLYATVLITGYSEVYGEIFQGDPETIDAAGQSGPNITGYTINKFWDRDYEGNQTRYGGDYPQIRYAEVLLSRLEAELEAGNAIDQNLLDNTINKVRQREAIDMPPVTETNPVELREVVRRERFVELSFEGGIGYFDLKRWDLLQEEASQELYGMKIAEGDQDQYAVNDEGHLIMGNLVFHEYNRLWPLPLHELETNSNLRQNPGYE